VIWGLGHSSYVLTGVGNYILDSFVTDGSTLSIERLEGSAFSELRVSGFKLASGADSTTIKIDSLSIQYNFWTVFKGKVNNISASHIDARLQRRNSGSFVLPTWRPSEKGESSIALKIGSIESIHAVIVQGDSTLVEVSKGAMGLHALRIGSKIELDVDTLWARLQYPSSNTEGLLKANLQLNSDRKLALLLHFETEKSQLDVAGHAFLDSLAVLGMNSMALTANGGIQLSDFEPFFPGLSKTEYVSFDAQTNQYQDSTKINGTIATLQSGQITFESTTLSASDSLVHSFSAQLSDINPGNSYSKLASITNLFGRVNGRVVGQSLNDAIGWMELQIDSGGYDELNLDRLRARVSKRGNRYTSAASIVMNAGRIEAQGNLENDHFDVKGTVRAINMVRIGPDLPNTNLNAKFDFNGDLDVNGLREANGTLLVQSSKLASCEIESGRVDATFNRKKAKIASTFTLCADSPLTSQVSIQRPTENWHAVSTLAVTGIRLSDVLALADPVSVSAKAEVAYSFDDCLSGTLQVKDLSSKSVRLDSAETTFKGTTKDLIFDAEVALGGGTLTTKARFNESSNVVIESGLIEHVDAFPIIKSDSPDSLMVEQYSSDLNGSISGHVDLGLPFIAGFLDINLDGSRLNSQEFSANIGAEFGKEKATAKINVVTPEGASVSGTLDWNELSQDVKALLDFEQFNPLSFAGLDGRSSLNGHVEGTAELQEDMPFSARLEVFEGSQFNDIGIRSTIFEASGNALENHQNAHGLIQLGLERGDVEASYYVSPDGAYSKVVVRKTDIAALLGIPATSSLSSSLTLNTIKEGDKWSRIRLQVDSLAGNYEHLVLNQGHISAALLANGLQIDSLRLIGSFGRITADGFLPQTPNQPPANLSFDVQLNHELTQLSQLKELGVGFNTFKSEGRLEGPSGQIRLISSFSVVGATFLPVKTNQIQGRLLGELGDHWAFSAAEMVAEMSLIEITPVIAETATLSASYDGAELTAAFDVHLSDSRDLNAKVSWLPIELPSEIALLELSASFDEDQWKMTGNSAIDIKEMVLLKPLVLSAGDQRIVALTTKTDSTVRNLITIQQVKIDPFADVMMYSDLGGVFGGTLTSLTRSDTTIVQGTLNGFVTAYDKPVGDINFQFFFDGIDTQLNASLKDTNGASLHLSGSVPKMNSDGPVQIQLAASSYSIDWIRSLIDPELIDDLRGRVNGEIRVSGTTQQPDWNGRIRLENGRVGIRTLGKRKGMVVNDIQANFLFQGELVTVDSMRAHSGDGWLRGAGTIDIKDLKLGEYNIVLNAEDFQAIDNSDYFAVVSGQMNLGGTTDRPKLGGRVTVNRGDFWLSDATTSDVFEPLSLSDEDLSILQRRFGLRILAADTTSFDAYDVLALEDFTVRMSRDTWIRSKSNPRMDIQLTGDLDVRKKPKQDPEVFGSITVLPERSRIIQFGKRFELDRGELTFNGPMKGPSLNMEASYTIPSRGSDSEEVTIRLIASGTPENLEVSFDSDPSMELADIFSYIATGRPAAASLQITGAQSDSYLESAAGLALGPVADLIENLAGSGLGLDVIEIEHTGFSGLTLTAGKYVSPKLYVSVSQPISLSSSVEAANATSKNQTQVTMEYELVRQLLLSLVNRGTILRVNLRWQLAF
jgi:translocation and assembly module TamB